MLGVKDLQTRFILASVKKTQIKAMQRRGYPLDDEDRTVLGMEGDELINYYVTKAKENGQIFPLSMNKTYERIVDEDGDPAEEGRPKRNMVYFVPLGPEKSICVEKITPIIALSQKVDVNDIDIIAQVGLYSHSAQALQKVKNRSFVHWTYTELIMDPFEHYLVPDYHIMTRKEVQETFYDDRGRPIVKLSKIGKIRKNWPIAKFLRLKPRQVLSYVYRQYYIPQLVQESLEYVVVVRESAPEQVDTSDDIDFEE